MDKTEAQDEVSTTSLSSADSLSFPSKLAQIELDRRISKPQVFSLEPPPGDCADKIPNFPQGTPEDKTITYEPTLSPDTWLLGGILGSRSAYLVFKSSALASPSEAAIQDKPGYKLHITYKVLQSETKLLSKLLECHGVTEVAINSSDFNLLWTGCHPRPGTLRSLSNHQRVNHFPRSYELTRKDRLYKNIERLQHAKGYKHFDFIPQTFLMPSEFAELCSTHHRIKGPWIVKPVASSRGRGIFIVETPGQVPIEEPVVVAKYIANPLLVAGHKCDLRLYVAVTSFDPLLIYIYEEGLVRFATVKYDSSHKQLWNPCMHLCNYSINKYHSDYVKADDPTAENVGHKWTLSALLRHLKGEGRDTAFLMSQIEDLIIKAILASAHSIISACKMFVPNNNNCFELYGFDILVDSELKPWLLEVNLSPSLGCDSPLDVRLKSAMLADLLTLVGIPAVDPMLRPSSSQLSTCSKSTSTTLKMKLGNCRRVHSADGLSNTLPKKSHAKSSRRLTSSVLTLSPEESRVLKYVKSQFDRRGGFVRIFPSVDSWSRYSQYLDPTTGVPISGNPATNVYNYSNTSNFNLLLYSQLFPGVPVTTNHKCDRPYGRINSMDHPKREPSPNVHDTRINSQQMRQSRYERMLSQGHRSALLPVKIHEDTEAVELRKKVIDLLKSGKKLTQWEVRKTFSHYLGCILKRITSGPNQQDHIDIVLKFLQKASNYLRTPYTVIVPSFELDKKDRAAMVAKQLNDFLYMYNRETDIFVDKLERSSHIPMKFYAQFLEHARECDLEEILIYQTTQSVPTQDIKNGVQGILAYIPNVRSCGTKPSLKPITKSKSLKVSSFS